MNHTEECREVKWRGAASHVSVCCLSLSFFNEFPPKKTKEQTELFRVTATETQTQTWSEGTQLCIQTITTTTT